MQQPKRNDAERISISAILVVALALVLTACNFIAAPEPTPTLEQRYPLLFGNGIEQLRCGNQSPRLKIWPSIVKVIAQTPEGVARGTGFVVDSESGYILTANHVVADAQTGNIEVRFRNGVTQPVTKVTQYATADISLLHTAPVEFPPLKVAQSNAPGIAVSAIGWVNDLYTSSAGQIVRVTKDNTGWTNIVTDARAEPGMSGGPLVNNCGELLGILSVGGPTGGVVAISLSQQQMEDLIAPTDEKVVSPVAPIPTPPPILSLTEAQSLISQLLRNCFLMLQIIQPEITARYIGDNAWLLEAKGVSQSLPSLNGLPILYGRWQLDEKTGELSPYDVTARGVQENLIPTCEDGFRAMAPNSTPLPSTESDEETSQTPNLYILFWVYSKEWEVQVVLDQTWNPYHTSFVRAEEAQKSFTELQVEFGAEVMNDLDSLVYLTALTAGDRLLTLAELALLAGLRTIPGELAGELGALIGLDPLQEVPITQEEKPFGGIPSFSSLADLTPDELSELAAISEISFGQPFSELERRARAKRLPSGGGPRLTFNGR